VPLLLPLAIPFFAFAAAVVIIGLSQTHTAQHGSATSSGFWQFLSSGLLKTLFGQIARAGRFIVSHFAAAQLNLLSKWLVAMGTLTAGWFGIEAGFAEAIVHAVERVMHRGDPKARARATTANTRAVHARHAADHANAHARHVGHDLGRYKAHANPRIAHATHAVDVTLPRSIGRVRTREDALSRDLGKVRERTRELENGAVKTWDWIRTNPLSGTTAVFTGAVAIALARMGFGFLRCRNWQKVGKSLTCGMGATVLHLLEAIATFALGELAILKPEVLAEEAVQAVDGLEYVLTNILEN
jgi:hypothetical protein